MRRRIVWVIAAAALLVGVIGCGGEEDADTFTVDIPPTPKEVDITLDGYPGPENVGILMAQQRGYFEKVGLDVWIRTPVSRLRPLPYVVEREVALSVSHQPQVVMAQEKGAPIEAFGSLISEPTAALIWLEQAEVDDIADLKGKTIAITGLPFEESFLEAALAQAGLGLGDVKVIRADYDLLPTLVKGRADAIMGSWNIEGAELEARGLQPVVTRVEDLGIPPYDELVLIARSERVDGEPGRIRSFMAALARGTAAAVEDPEAAARLIARQQGEKPGKALKAAVEATLPLLSESGSVSPDEELVDWMREEGMLP